MSRRCLNLGARLRRSRALSVCLGRRSWFVTPLDRKPGRPTLRESIILEQFRKPVVEFDPDLYEDQSMIDQASNLLLVACDAYLHASRLDQGWFEVTERANFLGSHVSIRVRTFDVLVQRANLLSRQLGNIAFVRNRKRFCEFMEGKGFLVANLNSTRSKYVFIRPYLILRLLSILGSANGVLVGRMFGQNMSTPNLRSKAPSLLAITTELFGLLPRSLGSGFVIDSCDRITIRIPTLRPAVVGNVVFAISCISIRQTSLRFLVLIFPILARLAMMRYPCFWAVRVHRC